MKTLIRAIRKIKRSDLAVIIVNTIMITVGLAYMLFILFMIIESN